MSDHREYLPALESVEAKLRLLPVLLIAIIYLSMIIVPIAVRFSAFKNLLKNLNPHDQHLIVFGGVITVALILWIVVRMAFCISCIKTDSRGITLRGPLKNRLIPWHEIKEVDYRRTKAGSPILIINTMADSIKLNASDFYGYGQAIISIWLRSNKNDIKSFELPSELKAVLEPISDDIPREIDWAPHKAASPKANIKKIAAIIVVFIGGISFLICSSPKDLTFTFIIAALYIFIFSTVIIDILKRACNVRLREDYLEVTTAQGKIYMPWSEVVSAGWNRLTLSVSSKNPKKEVRIPYTPGNRQSEQLMLALIRRMRTAGVPHALSLPVFANKNDLYKPAASNETRGIMKRAFISSLEEPARKRISKLYYAELILVMAGFLLGAVIAFSDAFGFVARFIYARPAAEVRYFVPLVDSMVLGVPLMLGLVLGFDIIFEVMIAPKLAGEYKNIWKEFCKVAPNTKFEKDSCMY